MQSPSFLRGVSAVRAMAATTTAANGTTTTTDTTALVEWRLQRAWPPLPVESVDAVESVQHIVRCESSANRCE